MQWLQCAKRPTPQGGEHSSETRASWDCCSVQSLACFGGPSNSVIGSVGLSPPPPTPAPMCQNSITHSLTSILSPTQQQLQILGEFTAPTVSYEVKPVSCPIYQDPDSGRNYVSFEDCSASTLTIKVTPRELGGCVHPRGWGGEEESLMCVSLGVRGRFCKCSAGCWGCGCSHVNFEDCSASTLTIKVTPRE
jgi:hypothetical protein